MCAENEAISLSHRGLSQNKHPGRARVRETERHSERERGLAAVTTV